MPSRSNLEIKARLVLGVGLLGLVVVLLLKLLLPVLALVGLAAGSYYLWQQWRRQQQQQQRRQNRINAQFYQLLQQQQGRISVLDFAMRTQLTGEAAQDYLNVQAQAFSAFFETTAQGDIIYVFNLGAVRQPAQHRPASQAEAAWAYAEQVRAERVQAEKTHAAWTNAKQIRTLRQISQQAGQGTSQRGGQGDRQQPRPNFQVSPKLKASAQSNKAKNPSPDENVLQCKVQKRAIDLPRPNDSTRPRLNTEGNAEGSVLTIDVKAVSS